ncbi:MAG: Holliday junction branch migration protein RuvA [Clostridia bacterium]|nr:Holliday junction branch migration protein RuvA [Clostridia bacterium]
MIYSVKGKVSYGGENLLIVDSGSVSFEVIASSQTVAKLVNVGDEVSVLTYLQVKEDGMALFGFADKEEKAIFLELINVSGIGPKMAISILSSIDPAALISAINSCNVKLLSGVKGLGKKTAERICLELKDKIGSSSEDNSAILFSKTQLNSEADDAISVLISLGYTKADATKAVESCLKTNPNFKAEELISGALKIIGRN